MRWWRNLLGSSKGVRVMQTPEQVDRRALKDRLIEEHLRANDAALQDLKQRVPEVSGRYISTMNQAMAIIKGE